MKIGFLFASILLITSCYSKKTGNQEPAEPISQNPQAAVHQNIHNDQALEEAVSSALEGNLNPLRTLFKQPTLDPNTPIVIFGNKRTPFCHAIYALNIDTVRIILQHPKTDINSACEVSKSSMFSGRSISFTPFFLLTKRNDRRSAQLKIAELLVDDRRFDINFFLQERSDSDKRISILALAIDLGSITVLKKLVELGAKYDRNNPESIYKRIDSVERRLSASDWKAFENEVYEVIRTPEEKALVRAYLANDFETVKKLITKHPESSNTRFRTQDLPSNEIICHALHDGRDDIAAVLIEARHDVFYSALCKTPDLFTPIGMILRNGNYKLLTAFVDHKDFNPDEDIWDNNVSQTLLCHAIELSLSPESIKSILEKSATIECALQSISTALSLITQKLLDSDYKRDELLSLFEQVANHPGFAMNIPAYVQVSLDGQFRFLYKLYPLGLAIATGDLKQVQGLMARGATQVGGIPGIVVMGGDSNNTPYDLASFLQKNATTATQQRRWYELRKAFHPCFSLADPILEEFTHEKIEISNRPNLTINTLARKLLAILHPDKHPNAEACQRVHERMKSSGTCTTLFSTVKETCVFEPFPEPSSVAGTEHEPSILPKQAALTLDECRSMVCGKNMSPASAWFFEGRTSRYKPSEALQKLADRFIQNERILSIAKLRLIEQGPNLAENMFHDPHSIAIAAMTLLLSHKKISADSYDVTFDRNTALVTKVKPKPSFTEGLKDKGAIEGLLLPLYLQSDYFKGMLNLKTMSGRATSVYEGIYGSLDAGIEADKRLATGLLKTLQESPDLQRLLRKTSERMTEFMNGDQTASPEELKTFFLDVRRLSFLLKLGKNPPEITVGDIQAYLKQVYFERDLAALAAKHIQKLETRGNTEKPLNDLTSAISEILTSSPSVEENTAFGKMTKEFIGAFATKIDQLAVSDSTRKILNSRIRNIKWVLPLTVEQVEVQQIKYFQSRIRTIEEDLAGIENDPSAAGMIKIQNVEIESDAEEFAFRESKRIAKALLAKASLYDNIHYGPIKTIEISGATVKAQALTFFAHELGHLIDFIFRTAPLSRDDTKKYEHAKTCLQSMHPRNEYDADTHQPHHYVAEDFADLVAGFAGKKNDFCTLGGLGELVNYNPTDPHSANFFRALHFSLVNEGKLPTACEESLRFSQVAKIQNCLEDSKLITH